MSKIELKYTDKRYIKDKTKLKLGDTVAFDVLGRGLCLGIYEGMFNNNLHYIRDTLDAYRLKNTIHGNLFTLSKKDFFKIKEVI